MEGISVWHWAIVFIYVAVFGIPVARILRRAGYSRWWVLIVFLPVLNLIGLWLFAYAHWPVLARERGA